jgi:GTP-binding protein
VGKSSLVNALIGEGRMLVSSKPGTTRDVVDVGVEIGGRRFIFLDTAGVRKKSSITARVEVVSSIKARKSIGTADCCIVVVDAAEGLTSQDKALCHMVDREGRGAIIAYNKWDLVPSGEEDGRAGDATIRRLRDDQLKSLEYAPLVTTCATSGLHVPRIVEHLNRIAGIQNRIVQEKELTAFLEGAAARTPPPTDRGKEVQFFRIIQAETSPARFRIYLRGYLPDHYLRFLERSLREAFDFEGVPIRIALVHR